MAKNADEEKFLASVHDTKIPILVLDQKWHHLFSDTGKPEEIATLEKGLSDLLARQGALNTEIKDLKRAKAKVMENIVQTMDKSTDENPMKGEETRLIDEINEKIDADQDELLEIPRTIKEANDNLMLATMEIMYERLHTNANESLKIKDWITQMRIELKKNIIRKQNMDLKNQEIYTYMHDIYGMEVLNLFDIKYEDKMETVDQAHDKPIVGTNPSKDA